MIIRPISCWLAAGWLPRLHRLHQFTLHDTRGLAYVKPSKTCSISIALHHASADRGLSVTRSWPHGPKTAAENCGPRIALMWYCKSCSGWVSPPVHPFLPLRAATRYKVHTCVRVWHRGIEYMKIARVSIPSSAHAHPGWTSCSRTSRQSLPPPAVLLFKGRVYAPAQSAGTVLRRRGRSRQLSR